MLSLKFIILSCDFLVFSRVFTSSKPAVKSLVTFYIVNLQLVQSNVNTGSVVYSRYMALLTHDFNQIVLIILRPHLNGYFHWLTWAQGLGLGMGLCCLSLLLPVILLVCANFSSEGRDVHYH